MILETTEIQNVDSEIAKDELKDEIATIPENDEDTEMVEELPSSSSPIEVQEEPKSPQPQNDLKLLNDEDYLSLQREKAMRMLDDTPLSLDDQDEKMLEVPAVEEVPETLEVDWVALKHRESDYFKELQLVELASATWKNDDVGQHYLKGCHFSPDGTCLLSSANLAGMSVFELPLDLYNKDEVDVNREITQLKPVIHVQTVGNLYDFTWYPFMNSSHPETCL